MIENDEIETLFKSIEPFTTIKDGFGFMGVVLRNKNTDTIQCHICGNWFKNLGQHVKGHKLNAENYKIKFGLPLQHPLCGLSY